MGADNALALMTKQGANGAAFPNVALNGGEILRGVPLLVMRRGAERRNHRAGCKLIRWQHRIAGAAKRAACKHPDGYDAGQPATASTTNINLWQQNMIGLLAERDFGWVQFRTGAVSAISGANYAATGNSP